MDPADTHRRRRPRRRHRGDRGAAVVEFALVVPVFVLLLMGIIDFANAYNDSNAVRQGVREGARQMVVGDWSISGCTSGTSSQRVACLTKDRIGLDAADVRVMVKLEGTYDQGQQATVCAMHEVRSITGMLSSVLDGRVTTSRITMRLEDLEPDSPITTYAETALPGQTWSWC